MARVEAVPQKCIYKIRAGAHCYIGQTVRGTERIDDHIRAAYYHGNLTGIYKHMQHYRMMDLEITYYEAPNYGIDNFSQAWKDFQSEWQSVGRMDAIDFAEIFHILRAVRQNEYIENTSMGGQSMGYQYIGPSASHKGKVLMRTMTPEEAYGVVMLGGAQSSLLADATTTLYQQMFSPDWASIYRNQYQTIYPNATTAELESFQDMLYQTIVPILANNLSRYTGKNKINPNSDIHAVIKQWLSSKQNLANAILQKWFNDKGIKAPLKINKQLDFSQLTDYLIEVINRWSYSLLGQSKKDISQQVSNFRPIRTSIVWKWSSLKKPHTNWLIAYNVKSPEQVNTDYLKYRSFLLFERTMRQVQKWDFKNLEIRTKEFKPQGELKVKNAYFHPEGEQTLSAKMHEGYYAAYQKQWLEFYRPMIAKWRKYHHYPEFQELISTDEREYLGYPDITDQEVYILYKNKNIKNSSNVFDWSEITIY